MNSGLLISSPKSHFKIPDASGSIPFDKVNCSQNDTFEFLAFDWPNEFLSNAEFLGVNKVNQKDCNHFLVQSMTVNGSSFQVDAWTATTDGLICRMSFTNQDTQQITAYSFDGFQAGYPPNALTCTSALLRCARDDWVCHVKNGTKTNDIVNALKWTCDPNGGKVNCAPINPGGKFFQPNTPLAHGNWAINQYFQANKILGGNTACNFGGIGEIVQPKTPSTQGAVAYRRPFTGVNMFERLSLGLVC